MSDWRTEGIEVNTGLDSRLGKDVAEAYAAARDQDLVTVLYEDGQREAAAIVPLDEHGYPVAMGLAASWLSQAARMRAEAGTRAATPFKLMRARADQLEECARAREAQTGMDVYLTLGKILDALDDANVPTAIRVAHAQAAIRRLRRTIVPDSESENEARRGEDSLSRTALLFAALISADALLGQAARDVLPPRTGSITYRQHIENWLREAS